MTPNERLLQQACNSAALALGVKIKTPFVVADADGNEHSFIALFEQVGTEKGTLVCEARDWMSKNQLAAKEGYYCSGLHADSYGKYDRNLWIETFRDWGWCGPKWLRPPWKGDGPIKRGDRRKS